MTPDKKVSRIDKQANRQADSRVERQHWAQVYRCARARSGLARVSRKQPQAQAQPVCRAPGTEDVRLSTRALLLREFYYVLCWLVLDYRKTRLSLSLKIIETTAGTDGQITR